jgi:beta-glucosidase/6-phospho-beta-glucosidase/beta-galactosidase
MDADGLVEGDEMLPHLVKGCDWIGVNYYMRRRVKPYRKEETRVSTTALPPRRNQVT